MRHLARSLSLLMTLLIVCVLTGCATVPQPQMQGNAYEDEVAALLGENQQAKKKTTTSRVTPFRFWFPNRFSDLMDCIYLGAGITSESKEMGAFFPPIGIYVEAMSFLNFGWLMHHGATIEWEGRGFGAYTESRTLWGFGPYREWKIHQGEQLVNYYKNSLRSVAWQTRMENDLKSIPRAAIFLNDQVEDRWKSTELLGEPAKKVLHKDTQFHRSFFGKPRGWHAWEYIGAEVALYEPFVLHHGVTVRAGIDLSEILDFALGFIFYDFKQDDRRNNE